MDTRISPSLCVPSFFISPQERGSRLGHADAPLLLDVRPQARFDLSSRMLAGAERWPADQIPAFAAALFASNPQQEVVVYCVDGHLVSANAAAALRTAGLNARALAGGFEGGEDGVDSAENTTQWRLARLSTVDKVSGSREPDETGKA